MNTLIQVSQLPVNQVVIDDLDGISLIDRERDTISYTRTLRSFLF